MQEKIAAFKEHLRKIEDDAVFDSIATLSKKMAEDFGNDFPGYSASTYKSSPLWHMIVGSSVPQNYVDTTPQDVQLWLDKKLAEFLETV